MWLFVLLTNSPLDIQTVEKSYLNLRVVERGFFFSNIKLVQSVVSDVLEVVQLPYAMYMKCDLSLVMNLNVMVSFSLCVI